MVACEQRRRAHRGPANAPQRMAMSPIPGIPDFPALLAAVRAAATNLGSCIHGERHWRAVAWIGLHLARATPGADPVLALLFGLFHDARRADDGRDPEHGLRGAELVLELRAHYLDLTARQLALLVAACVLHSEGQITEQPTIGVCWDADRLQLSRLDIEP